MSATALAPTNGSIATANPSDQTAILRALKLDPHDANTQALVLTCNRYGLDPLLKHAVLISGSLYVTRDGGYYQQVRRERDGRARMWAAVRGEVA